MGETWFGSSPWENKNYVCYSVNWPPAQPGPTMLCGWYMIHKVSTVLATLREVECLWFRWSPGLCVLRTGQSCLEHNTQPWALQGKKDIEKLERILRTAARWCVSIKKSWGSEDTWDQEKEQIKGHVSAASDMWWVVMWKLVWTSSVDTSRPAIPDYPYLLGHTGHTHPHGRPLFLDCPPTLVEK